jgi:small subunit ribosomal protein S6
MRLYESVFIARQDISTTQVESMADEFAGIITNAGGKVHKREYWGLRSLAYRIKKNRKGHYIMFNLETDGPTLKEYERIMGLNEDVLRFLNIRIEEVEEAPSIIMQNKGERSERGDRDRGDRDRGDRGPRGPRPDQSDRGGDRSASEAKADAPKAGEDAPAEAAASDDKGSAESAASEE